VMGARGRVSALIALADGTEMPVVVGSQMPNGSVVTAIDRGGVAFRNDGRITRMGFVGESGASSRQGRAENAARVQDVAAPLVFMPVAPAQAQPPAASTTSASSATANAAPPSGQAASQATSAD